MVKKSLTNETNSTNTHEQVLDNNQVEFEGPVNGQRYLFPRPKKGFALVINIRKTNNFVGNIRKLKTSLTNLNFEVLSEKETNEDIYSRLEKEDFSDFNIFFLYVLSDCQIGHDVKSIAETKIDFVRLTQSIANNLTLLGYPKVLIFDSVLDGGGVSLKDEEIGENSRFFFDIVLIKIISQRHSKFIREFSENVEKFEKEKELEEIFFETVASSRPQKWEFLSHLRKKFFLSEGYI